MGLTIYPSESHIIDSLSAILDENGVLFDDIQVEVVVHVTTTIPMGSWKARQAVYDAENALQDRMKDVLFDFHLKLTELPTNDHD